VSQQNMPETLLVVIFSENPKGFDWKSLMNEERNNLTKRVCIGFYRTVIRVRAIPEIQALLMQTYNITTLYNCYPSCKFWRCKNAHICLWQILEISRRKWIKTWNVDRAPRKSLAKWTLTRTPHKRKGQTCAVILWANNICWQLSW